VVKTKIIKEYKMSEMNYEMLLRNAFGLSMKVAINRYGDPASLADADHFRNDNIVSVKIGTGYAMEIFINHILKNKGLDGDEDDRVEGFPTRVLNSDSLSAIADLIAEFDSTVINEYFHAEDGRLSLK
jgi:hypothetical protein